jgi:hypothetical protein
MPNGAFFLDFFKAGLLTLGLGEEEEDEDAAEDAEDEEDDEGEASLMLGRAFNINRFFFFDFLASSLTSLRFWPSPLAVDCIGSG